MKNTLHHISLVDVFKIEEYLLRKNMLRLVTPKLQVWNVEIMSLNERKIIYNMESIVVLYHRFYAFILMMYETTKFNRIIVTQAISFKKYPAQVNYAKSLGDYFITKWLPGMFTGREYFVRNFYYKWYKGIKIFKKSKLKSCISQLYKMIRLPSLLCVYTFKRENQIIIKEAVLNKVASIGMFENFIFPTNSTFRLTGRVKTVYSTCIFLNILILAMDFGRSLYYKRFSIDIDIKDVDKMKKKTEKRKLKAIADEEGYIISLVKERKFIKKFKIKNKVKILRNKNKVKSYYPTFFFSIFLLSIMTKILKIKKEKKKKKKVRLYKTLYRKIKKSKIKKMINYYRNVFLSKKNKVRRRPKFRYRALKKRRKKVFLFIRKNLSLMRRIDSLKKLCFRIAERRFYKRRIKKIDVKQ